MPKFEAKFPRGEKMTVEEVAAVVGDEFKQMNENPPASVVKVREEMMGKAARQRLTWHAAATKAEEKALDDVADEVKEAEDEAEDVSPTADDPVEDAKKDVADLPKAASGLYGYTKAVQRSAEAATRKLARTALRVAKRAFAKDEDVVSFLKTHAKREGSKSAKVLLAAMKEIGPKLASEMRGGQSKQAGAPDYGLYGFKSKTADLGLDACKEIRSAAGRITSDLHRGARGAMHEKFTGFLKEHSKQAKCAYAGMLYSCYPDASVKIASAPPELLFLFPESLRFIPTSPQAKQAGTLRDIELLPYEYRQFVRVARMKAAGMGADPSQVKFQRVAFSDIFVSMLPNDDQTRDLEGVARVVASWEGAPRLQANIGFTGVLGSGPAMTVLASGDWIEWEE